MIEAICQSCGAKIQYGPDTEPLPHVTPDYVVGRETIPGGNPCSGGANPFGTSPRARKADTKRKGL